jgi:RNA polymerase sigma factor (sigma-70 family)
MRKYAELSDEELMCAYADGDGEAFSRLYERHSGKVYAYLQKRLRDRTLVDDVFQASFLKLHRYRRRYDPSFPFQPWLFTITRTVMLDTLKKHSFKFEQPHSIAAEQAVAPEPEEPKAELPSFDGLSANQKSAIELRYNEDLPFEEIAKRLGTSAVNARQLVSRAVKRLRRNK